MCSVNIQMSTAYPTLVPSSLLALPLHGNATNRMNSLKVIRFVYLTNRKRKNFLQFVTVILSFNQKEGLYNKCVMFTYSALRWH